MDLGLGIVVSLKDMLSRNSGRIERSMESLDGTVARTSQSMTRHLDRIEKGAMMAGAGLALLAAPVALLSATAETQKALGELASLGVKDLRALDDAAESFTNRWSGTTKAQFITSAYDVRSALANLSDEAVGRFTSMAALTAKATKATTDEMVGTFTTAYGIYKPIMRNMSDMVWAETFAGAMAQTVASFKTNGKQMSDAIKNIGAIAASANIPLEEQLAILGQLQTTMPGSEAGTLYKAFIMKAAEAGDKLGVSMVGANGQLLGILPMMEAIRRKFPDMSKAAAQVEIKKAFGSDEAVKFLLQMSQGLDGLRDNIQSVSRAMATGTAVTQTMARAMNGDIGAGFATIRQQFGNLLEILGRTLIPVVTPVLRLVSQVIIGLQKAAKGAPGLIQVLLTLVSVLGAFLVVAGGVVMTLGAAGLALPAIKAGIAGFGAALTAAGGTLAAYFWPVTLAIATVVAAVFALRAAWQGNFGGIRDAVESTVARLRLAFRGIWSLISSLENGTGKLSSGLAKQLEDAGLMGFVTGVFQFYYRLRQVVVGFVTALREAGRRIHQILGPAVGALVSAYSSLVKVSLSVFETFGLITNAADSSSFLALGQALGTVLGMVAQVGALLLKLIIVPLARLIRLVATVAGVLVWLGTRAAFGLAQGARAVYTYFLPLRLLVQAFRMVGRLAYGLWGILSGGTSVFEGLKDMSAAIRDFLFTPLRWVGDIIEGLWRKFRGFVSGVVALTQWLGDVLMQGLKKHPLVQPFLELFTLAEGLQEKRQLFFDAGRDWLLSLADGIWSAITEPVRRLKKGLAGLKAWLPWQNQHDMTIVAKAGLNLSEPRKQGRQGLSPDPVFKSSQVPEAASTNHGVVYPRRLVERFFPATSVPFPKQITTTKGFAPQRLPSAGRPDGHGPRVVLHQGRDETQRPMVSMLGKVFRQLKESIAERLPSRSVWRRDPSSRSGRIPPMMWKLPQVALATLAFSPLLAFPSLELGTDQARDPQGLTPIINLNRPVDRTRPFKPTSRGGFTGPLSLPGKVSGVAEAGRGVSIAVRPASASIPVGRERVSISSAYPVVPPSLTAQTLPKLGPRIVAESLFVKMLQVGMTDGLPLTSGLQPDVAPRSNPMLFSGLLLLTQRLVSPIADAVSADWWVRPRLANEVVGKQEPESPVPQSFEITQRHLLAQRRMPNEGMPSHEGIAPHESLVPILEDLLQKIDALSRRPINLHIKTELDGWEIAEAVYRDIREQKVKNYETFL